MNKISATSVHLHLADAFVSLYTFCILIKRETQRNIWLSLTHNLYNRKSSLQQPPNDKLIPKI